MAQKDRAALQAQAAEIKNETTQGANTATRVGTMLEDIIDSNQNRVSDLIPELQTQTGSTIVFTAYNEYNAASPLTSGDITIDPTNAVAGAYASVYYNGATEPNITGANVLLTSGTFVENELNIFHFFWNTNGDAILTIQNGGVLPQLLTPTIDLLAGDALIDLTFSGIDANATTNVLERSTDDVNYSIVGGYNGTDLAYQDTGLTNGTEYFYRFKSTASGFQDSNYATGSTTPQAGIVQLPQITGLAATDGQDSEVPLTWNATSGNEIHISVQRSLSSGSGFTEIAQVVTSSTAYTDTTVSNGTQYFYRVQEVGDGVSFSDGPVSAEVSATPQVSGYLLDTYPANVAYSLRKLRNAATYACQVRRVSDGATADVVLETTGSIDLNSTIENATVGSETTLGAWVGSQNSFVSKWYDQSGNSKDAEQAVEGSMPILTNGSGALFLRNGQPSLSYFRTSTTKGLAFNESFAAGGDVSSFSVIDNNVTGNFGIWGSFEITENIFNWGLASNKLGARGYDGSNRTAIATNDTLTGQKLVTGTWVSNDSVKVFLNGAEEGSDILNSMSAVTSQDMGVGTIKPTTLDINETLDGYFQEFIMYKSDQTANKTAIESNINTYYSIF